MLDDEYNESRCANAVAAPHRGQTTVIGRRGLGPRVQEAQRTQRASFVATFEYHMSTHHTWYTAAKQQSVIIVLGSDAWLKKKNSYHVKRLSARLFAASAGLGPSEVQSARLFAVPNTALVDVVLNFWDLRN